MNSPILISLLMLVFLSQSAGNYTYCVNYLDVPLDHFSFSKNTTFKLRYLVNDSYWKVDGPIFFYTGNEGDINLFAQNTGFIWEIAPVFEALVVFAEHRYYGQSLPFGNMSFSSPEYVGYLTSAQALADYVYLIEFIQGRNKLKNGRKNPVIAFGGSYGGMLSAWIRMKYPGSVYGAIASSAPIFQFPDLTPCEAFSRIATSSFGSESNICVQLIKRSWSTIRNVTKTSANKLWLSNDWKLCKNLTTNADIDNLLYWISDVLTNIAMVNYPYPTDFLAPLPGHPVKEFCKFLKNGALTGKDAIQALGRALSVYTNYTKVSKCVNIDTTSESLGEQGWDFQACTEMVMPICSDNNDMFENSPWNWTKFSEDCYNKWRVKVTNPNLAQFEYGGKEIKAASNIVFSNGMLDPWSSGGVLHNISKTVLALLIPDAAHHLDLRASNPADPKSVVHARNFHKHAIHNWLKMYYAQKHL